MTEETGNRERYIRLNEVWEQVIGRYTWDVINNIIDKIYGIALNEDDFTKTVFGENSSIVTCLELQGYKPSDLYFARTLLHYWIDKIAKGKGAMEEEYETLLRDAEILLSSNVTNLDEFLNSEDRVKGLIEQECDVSVKADRKKKLERLNEIADWMIAELKRRVPDLNFVDFKRDFEINYIPIEGIENPRHASHYSQRTKAKVYWEISDNLILELSPVYNRRNATWGDFETNNYNAVILIIEKNGNSFYRQIIYDIDPKSLQLEIIQFIREGMGLDNGE